MQDLKQQALKQQEERIELAAVCNKCRLHMVRRL
jgi:hypothetical protein